MARKKIDRRILDLLQRSSASRHRCMFFICGTNARDQVPLLHHLLLVCRRGHGAEEKPSVLWCFKKMDPGLTGHHLRKRLKQLRRQYSGGGDDLLLSEDSAFDHFLLSADPHFCHYSETERVLGRTFSLAVLEDVEAVTPNALSRVTECVEGGGALLLLLARCPTLHHLAQLTLDAHARFTTESHPVVRPLFHGRTVRSPPPPSCCLLLDDRLRVTLLPPAPHREEDGEPESVPSLPSSVPSSLTDPGRAIFSVCRTDDQRNALACLHAALEGDTSALVSLTAARGRGKSAVLGLGVALALECGVAGGVLLTSPHPDNVQPLFAFVARGLEAAGWEEGVDFQVVHGASSLVTSVRVTRGGRRVRWVRHLLPAEAPPTGGGPGSTVELVVVDEAAAIPLPLVRRWIGWEGATVFMASTIQGYEGTGRSLSLKLLHELRNPDNRKTGRVLREVELREAVRYADGDPVERWLGRLLCLEEDTADDPFFHGELPPAHECQLFHVDRRVLFGCSTGAERFLRRLVWLFVSSHYRNSPDDLLMMADAPAHALFALLPPTTTTPPRPLCAIQVSLEGGVSLEQQQQEGGSRRRGAGDLIPWIVAQQFQDEDFPSLRGGRVVRIATHPDCQRMGYGQRALSLLSEFYSRRGPVAAPAPCGPGPIPSQSALLSRLEDVPLVEPLHYLGVSYGLTPELLKFWKRAGFLSLYVRQTTSEVTGEHSCVMVRPLQQGGGSPWWPRDYCQDFRGRFSALLPTAFRLLPCPLATQLLRTDEEEGQREDRGLRLGERDVGRLSAYCRGEVDYHLVLDLVPKMAPLLHTLNHAQGCVVLGMGLQGKSVEEAADELGLEPSRVLGLLRRAVSRMLATLHTGV